MAHCAYALPIVAFGPIDNGDGLGAAELRAQAARARALADFSHAVNVAVDDFDASLRIVAKRTAEALGDMCSIGLLSEDGRFVEAAARHTPDPRLAPVASAFDAEGPQPVGEYAHLSVFEGGGTVFVPELAGPRADFMHERLRQRGMPADIRVRSLIAIPLESRGVVIGVVTLARTNPELPSYTEADRDFAEELALRAAMAIDNARLFRSVQSISGALALSQRRLQAVFDAAPVGIVTRDLEGRVIEVNRAYADMLGFSPETLVGTGIDHVAGDASASKRLDEILSAGVLAPTRQRYRRRDGSELEAQVTGALVRGDDGHPRFAVAVVEDTTERRRLEAQLQQSQKMEALGRLAGGVAHDFNNLLTAILGFGESLLAELEDGSAHFRDAEEITGAARHGAALTNQLLAFSRRRLVERAAVDLGAVANDLVGMLGRLIGDAIVLAVETPRPAVVWADRHQLEQVMLNLAINARDAMPDGGRLTIAVRQQAITGDETMFDVEPGEYAVLSVTDQGIGMDADTVARIFEPFYTTKAPGVGTGLGLSTVFGIVHQNGGRVSVYSEPGQGSTFRVLLPLYGGPTTPASEPRRRTESSSTSHTVLIAEDEPAIRRIVQRVLERAGHSVLLAEDGASALAAAASAEKFDLLLTDVSMPDMTGFELARQLREQHPNLPVLFSSGYAGADVLSRAGTEGARFLEKPFGPVELLHEIDAAMGNTD